MDYVRNLFTRFRKVPETQIQVDVFDVRLRQLSGQSRRAPRATPFKTRRLRPAT